MSPDADIDEGRRTVLGAALATFLPATGLARPQQVRTLPAAIPQTSDNADPNVFPQGVASGGPTRTGVVCWTRLAPDAYSQAATLRLTVATEETLADTVGSWQIPTDRLSDHDYTVKIALDETLDPGRSYYYQFAYDGATSPIGRCQTLPTADASPDRVAFGLATCQDYRNGYYGAYSHIADADIDFILHLGDFIYEHGGESSYDGRSLSLPSGESVVMDIDDFRYLHRTYRTDRFLQAALAAHPIVPTWDDHEIVNNRYWDYEEGRPYAGEGDHPRNDDPEFMTQLFADGIRAWWEYTPTRVPYDPDADSLLEQITLWRTLQFGDLVDVLVTDERLYRTAPADGEQFETSVRATDGTLSETMLGARQREWFTDRLAASTTAWTAWANEVLAMSFDLDVGDAELLNADAWDAFPTERDRILQQATEGDGTLVALTGDMHTALAGHIDTESQRYGVEFMTPAITSQNLRELLNLEDSADSRSLVASYVKRANPHVDFFDSHDWGYATVEFTPEACTYSAYVVDKDDDSADADRRLLARYRTPVGTHDLERLD